MRLFAKTAWVAAAAGAVAALAGCVPQFENPPEATKAETDAVAARSNQVWWDSMFPGEDPPQVTPVRYDTPAQQATDVQLCMSTVNDNEDTYDRQRWVCTQRYPLDYQSPPLRGAVLGGAQLEYLYGYFTERMVPCLRFAGYAVTGQPDRAAFMASSLGFPAWVPYDWLSPTPQNDAQWQRVTTRCPPPAFAARIAPFNALP